MQTVCDNLIELDQTVPSGTGDTEEVERAPRRGDRRRRRGDRNDAHVDLQAALQPILDDPESEASEEILRAVQRDARVGR